MTDLHWLAVASASAQIHCHISSHQDRQGNLSIDRQMQENHCLDGTSFHCMIHLLCLCSDLRMTGLGQDRSSVLWGHCGANHAIPRLTHTQPLAGMVAVLVTGNTNVHCIMMCREGCHHHEPIVETIMTQFDSLTLHHCLRCLLVLPVRLDAHGDVLFHCAPRTMMFQW